MTPRRLHRTFAAMLGIFLTLHLAHHATLLGGTDAHLAVQSVLSPLYRWLPVELVLLGLFIAQIVLGAGLARRLWRFAKGWRQVQILSGALLGAFILVHATAALVYRSQGLDTTVHFAASGMFHPLWRWYFIAYYPAGVTALGLHLAATLALRNIGPRWVPIALPLGCLLYATIVVIGLSGGFGGPPPPADYLYSGSVLP